MASPASKAECVQQLLPWWGKLAHRALAARAADREVDESDEDEVNNSALRASGICVRAAVDGDAGA